MGDADATTIYASVGHALSMWEWMESTLAHIFGALCQAQSDSAVRAYGSLMAFSGRRDMLAAAYRVFPWREEAGGDKFEKFLEEVSRFAARRNEIAHGVVVLSGTVSKSSGYYLFPAFYNSVKRKPWKEASKLRPHDRMLDALDGYSYNSKQVDYYANQFARLDDDAKVWLVAFLRLIPKNL